MVTITLCPTMRYSPLTMLWEKRPESLSPTRAASFSFATLLALASSDRGSIVVSMLKVLATLFLPHLLAYGRLNERTGYSPSPTQHLLPLAITGLQVALVSRDELRASR